MGLPVGGGVEMMATQTFSIGVEYLYTSLDDDEFRVRAGPPAPATSAFIQVNPAGANFARSDEDFETSSVRFTASYRFAM